MIALFLKTEVESTRWGPVLLQQLLCDHVSRKIVDNPDVTNSLENEYRFKLLGKFRGYRQNKGLFENFPKHVAWERVALSQNEFWAIRYIAYDYWIELSGGSRLPIDAARAIKAGKEIFRISNDGFIKFANSLRQGATFPELITVRASEDSSIVVLEGHKRLTAYALAPETVPIESTVIMGTSHEMIYWDLY